MSTPIDFVIGMAKPVAAIKPSVATTTQRPASTTVEGLAQRAISVASGLPQLDRSASSLQQAALAELRPVTASAKSRPVTAYSLPNPSKTQRATLVASDLPTESLVAVDRSASSLQRAVSAELRSVTTNPLPSYLAGSSLNGAQTGHGLNKAQNPQASSSDTDYGIPKLAGKTPSIIGSHSTNVTDKPRAFANSFRYWSTTETNQILEDFKNKKPIEEIAEKHGRSSKAVEMRLQIIAAKMAKDKVPIKDIAVKFNASEAQVEGFIAAEQERQNKKIRSAERSAERRKSITNVTTGTIAGESLNNTVSLHQKLDTLTAMVARLLEQNGDF